MNILRCLSGATDRLKIPRAFTINRHPSWQVSLLRLATLTLYGWLAALLVYPLLPWLVYIRPEQWLPLNGPPLLYGFVMLTYALVAVLLVLYLQATFFIRLPYRRFKYGYCIDLMGWLRYPTLHLSVLIGLGCLFYLDGTDGPQSNAGTLSVVTEQIKLLTTWTAKDQPRIPILDSIGLWVALILYGVIQCRRSEIEQAQESEPSASETKIIGLASCPDDEFEKWLSVEQPTNGSLDFFDREPYVARIKDRIEQPLKDNQKEHSIGRGQIILGEFGSGKTTIIKMVEKQLSDEWIVSYFDCWQRSGKPEELAAQFMEQIIHDVGQQIEVTSLARLPESFAHALYGSSHWFSLLDAAFRPDTPEEVIQQLNSLLSWHNRKLLIVVENVDRNKDRDLFVDVLSAILDKLPRNGYIKFIFSADENSIDTELIYRISSYKERVVCWNIQEIILRFMGFCLSKSFSGEVNGVETVIPYLNHEFHISGGSEHSISMIAEAFDMKAYAKDSRRVLYDQPIGYQLLESISEVLSNPRRLKYVLRKVYRIWITQFSGEVNLLDLIIYSISEEDGKLKEILKKYSNLILDEKMYSAYVSPSYIELLGKEFGTEEEESKSLDRVIGSGNRSRIRLAHHLLNAENKGSYNSRVRSQPIIEENGIGEERFSKYRKSAEIGKIDGFLYEDQKFLRNYIAACDNNYNESAVRYVLDVWLENLPIAYNLTESMTNEYFESDSQAIRFLGNALTISDQRYVSGYKNYIFHDLMHLSIQSTKENPERLNELTAQVNRSLLAVFEIGEYQWTFRVLWRMIDDIGYKVGYFKEIYDPIFQAFITPETAEDLSGRYIEKVRNCDLLTDFFFILTEEVISQPPHDEKYFSEFTMRQCAYTFLKFMALVREQETNAVKIIDERLNRSDNGFRQFHENLKSYLDDDSLTEAEMEVLKDFEGA
jgi:hypothetical protein